MEEFRALLAARMKRLRIAAGLRQSQLAEICGIETNTLSRYERGVIAPTIEQILIISNALGISPVQLAIPGGPENLVLARKMQLNTDHVESFKLYVGKKIRDARNDKGITQNTLAEKLGMNVNTLGRYENGINAPSVEHLIKIADILSISPIGLIPNIPERTGISRRVALRRQITKTINSIKTDENLEKVLAESRKILLLEKN